MRCLFKPAVLFSFAALFALSACGGGGGGGGTAPGNGGTEINQLLVATGQNFCSYYDSGWSKDTDCTNSSYTNSSEQYPLGQDAHYPDAPSARSFTGPTALVDYPDDYTTRDNNTGLVWKTCIEGVSGVDCGAGSSLNKEWTDAVEACADLNAQNAGAGYAGRTDWRLPEITELTTLIDYDKHNADETHFPNNEEWAYFWSATELISTSTDAWYASFSYGSAVEEPKTNTYQVRCVAGP